MSTGPSDVTAIKAGPSDPVHITGYDAAVPGVSVAPATGPSASASAISGPNTARRLWAIQNLGTNVLAVKLGAGASATSFNILLKAGIAQDDGTGGYISDEIYKGPVSVFPLSGAARYVATDL